MRAARFAAFAGALLFFALASTASAAVRPVDIANFAFQPQSLTITVGDTVTWTNKDTFQHSARVAGVGTTATLSQGQSASLTFTAVGTFPYDCGIHGAAMMGTVIVRAAATPVPTPIPTPVPTARPTVAPTVAPTVEPTPTASPAPTATPSPAPTTAAPSATASATVAVVVPTQQAPAPAASNDGGASPLLIAGTAVVMVGLVAFALTRIRR
jgi:plastocyanin